VKEGSIAIAAMIDPMATQRERGKNEEGTGREGRKREAVFLTSLKVVKTRRRRGAIERDSTMGGRKKEGWAGERKSEAGAQPGWVAKINYRLAEKAEVRGRGGGDEREAKRTEGRGQLKGQTPGKLKRGAGRGGGTGLREGKATKWGDDNLVD